jgi:hypothetical protein
VHQGAVQPNGLVDTAQAITNPSVLIVQLVEDALRLTSLRLDGEEIHEAALYKSMCIREIGRWRQRSG